MLLISWKDTHPLTRCVSFLYGTNIDLFALSHRILTFDTGNEATVLHLGEKPDKLRLLQKWGGRFYLHGDHYDYCIWLNWGEHAAV